MEYLCSVVGLDGAGKSTAIAGVKSLLKAEGITCDSFHDRKSDPASAKVNELIRTAEFSPEARMHLIVAGRRQIIDRQIIPSMQINDVTITDRYVPCMIAYQAYGEGLDLDMVMDIARRGVHGADANRTFVLDIAANIAKTRKDMRGQKQFYDAEEIAFHDRVRQGYLEQARDDDTFTVIDGLASREDVACIIASVIMRDVQHSS